MNNLTIKDFAEFFSAINCDRAGIPFTPMHWQRELAEAACEGHWPNIDVPTGAGKTSALDVAVFALAVQADRPPEQRTAPMRTFLVVDRRTVVSEAFHKAKQIRKCLAEATEGILKTVADRLLSYTGHATGSPLEITELRGGIYRDPSWFNALNQPMLVTSTVDQVGSRLLFRGYGVSNSSRPVQATAIAHDSLIILDEAHISQPFSQTLQAVSNFQKAPWSELPQPLPLKIVEMTATPTDSHANKIEISTTELNDPSTRVGRLANMSKPVTVEVAENVKGGKAPKLLAKYLVEHAIKAAFRETDAGDIEDQPVIVIGIMCNMVATAKETMAALLKDKRISPAQTHLIVGAMRPLDRDEQTDFLRDNIATGADRSQLAETIFVVSTQCIEVGADYDFDVLITEAAPISSLVQRFGRLNRAANSDSAYGVIVMRGDRVKTDDLLEEDGKLFKYLDPIYGNATSYSWNWLLSIAEDQSVDFGINAFKSSLASANSETKDRFSLAHTKAPTLLPAHMDMLCQTSDRIWPDPDVSLWLHGPQRNDPEVQICWRADILERIFPDPGGEGIVSFVPLSKDSMVQNVSLCPPSSPECLSVPMRRVMAWLTSVCQNKKTTDDLSGDVPQLVEQQNYDPQIIPSAFRPLAWRGVEKSDVIMNITQIRPGDTLVFSPLAGGWNELGYLPEFNEFVARDEQGIQLPKRLANMDETERQVYRCNAEDWWKLVGVDLGDKAFAQSRNRPIARVQWNLFEKHDAEIIRFCVKSGDFSATKSEAVDLADRWIKDSAVSFSAIKKSEIRMDFYAYRRGFVLVGPAEKNQLPFLTNDDGSDILSNSGTGNPVGLQQHLDAVRDETVNSTAKLPLSSLANTFAHAGAVHDWGKADERFQALLIGADPMTAMWEPELYAKSGKNLTSPRERQHATQLAELPKNFRHELLSVLLAERAKPELVDVEDFELMLHLIAAHHGHSRATVPVCIDPEPPEVSLEQIGRPEIAVSAADRAEVVFHRYDSRTVERFWSMNRKYGWWGLAFLESTLRLADRRVSQLEEFGYYDQQSKKDQVLS